MNTLTRTTHLDTLVWKTKERIKLVLDIYPKIYISFSGGKDSTVLAELVRQICKEHGKPFISIFNDIETIAPEITDFVVMRQKRYNVHLLQAPVIFKSSGELPTWTNWDEKYKDYWCKPHIGMIPEIKLNSWFNLFTDYSKYLSDDLPFCNFVGLRSQESFHRNMTTTRTKKNNPINWLYDHGNYAKCYPIFDWTWQNVWDYIIDNNLGYNKCYDYWTNSKVKHSISRTGSLYSAAKGQSKQRWESLFRFEQYNEDFFNRIIKRMELIGVDINKYRE